MKINDKIPVTIGGQVVAQANVKEVSEGQVTLVVPATLVVMATRTELSVPEPVEPEIETVITGVEQAGQAEVPAEVPDIATEGTEQSAPVVESTAPAEPVEANTEVAEAPAPEAPMVEASTGEASGAAPEPGGSGE